jgi:hypothetical protein
MEMSETMIDTEVKELEVVSLISIKILRILFFD